MDKLAIFVSGGGTNMVNIVRYIHEGKLPAKAAVVICDKPDAKAIDHARDLGVSVAVVDRKQYADKPAFEQALMRAVDKAHADWLVLAGFMRILSREFVIRYWGRIINIHPSFLPEFPGAHGIQDAFEAKVSETGVSVHFVDDGVDSGPIILQERVPVMPDDTLESLEARVHEVEYQIYPQALNVVLEGKVQMQEPKPE